MTITRSHGIAVGMYRPGGGYSGITPDLDAKVVEIARAMESEFARNIEIRFNSDRLSGGAYIKGLPESVGVGAKLWSLSEMRRDFQKYGHLDSGGTFRDWCARRGVEYSGFENQITLDVVISAEFLRDPADATEGNAGHRYAYIQAASVQDAIRMLKEKSTIEKGVKP